MSLAGLDELVALERALEQLADGTAAAVEAAPALLEVAQRQWSAGQAPDGSSWALTRDGRVPLQDLTGQATARADGAEVVLELPDELLPHQVGSPRLPRRPVVPGPGEELPAAWEKPLEDAMRKALEAAYSGAR